MAVQGLNGTDDRSDEAYVLDLVQAVRARGDGGRVAIAGESNGGLLAVQMVCRHPGLFAGLGLINAALPVALAAECPVLPPRAVVVNGDEDAVFPFSGGEGDAVSGANDGVRQARGAAHGARFCATFDRQRLAVDRPGAFFVTRIDGIGCRREGVTRLYQIHGGGHDAWGGERWLWRLMGTERFLAPEAVVDGLAR